MEYSINNKVRNTAIAVVLSLSFVTSALAYDFSLNLTFHSSYTASQQTIFNNAAAYWEGVITGYQPGYTGVDGIDIDVGIIPAADSDGEYGVLGWGGWDTYVTETPGQYFTETGSMQYDVPDIARLENNNTLFEVAVHEIAHILGFGTWWNYDSDINYVDGSGEYRGAAALAAYRAEFDPNADFVPVELDGGSGTADGHWDESIGANELMTGWLNSPTFTSNTTIASFIDLGYTVNLAAVPLPAAVWLFGSGLLGLVGWSKRKQAA
jgi:hypothetical protein